MNAPFPVRLAPFLEAEADARFMAAALALARRGLGQTFPNPSVAAIVVAFDGARHIVQGRGVTAAGGRPHAERLALQQAGDSARGATLYVTLEPCNRHSRSGFGPSCADQIIAAGIARVVLSTADPSPYADGLGLRRLRQHGVDVAVFDDGGVGRRLNRGHELRIRESRPLVALKLAMTADGYAGTQGARLMITGEAAQARVHAMRAAFDAIMIGIGTALADNPSLTCRIPGAEQRSPVRVVLDRHLRLPLHGELARSATIVPVIVIGGLTASADNEAALRAAGCEVWRVAAGPEGLDLAAVLHLLASSGVTRLMVEGGPALAEAFARRNLVDLLHLWRSPNAVAERAPGATGIRALGPGLESLLSHPDFPEVDRFAAGPDECRIHERNV
jgi:diaminohydroxyphosphoribosylaminopyrimidine deaminase / 5-amino-6-(5-phosphoribosylamino)uracil reductase